MVDQHCSASHDAVKTDCFCQDSQVGASTLDQRGKYNISMNPDNSLDWKKTCCTLNNRIRQCVLKSSRNDGKKNLILYALQTK